MSYINCLSQLHLFTQISSINAYPGFSPRYLLFQSLSCQRLHLRPSQHLPEYHYIRPLR